MRNASSFLSPPTNGRIFVPNFIPLAHSSTLMYARIRKEQVDIPPPIFTRAWTRVMCVSVRLSNTNDLPRPRGVAVKPVKRERENATKLTINLPSAVAKQLQLFATVYFPALPPPLFFLHSHRSTEGNNSGSHPVSKVTSCIQRALVGRKSRWKYCHALRELRREP